MPRPEVPWSVKKMLLSQALWQESHFKPGHWWDQFGKLHTLDQAWEKYVREGKRRLDAGSKQH